MGKMGSELFFTPLSFLKNNSDPIFPDILLQVKKPAQYIGCEWNVSKKDFDKAALRFGLCFPDLYEVGMSNLGLRIIYGLLNSIPDVCCERIFSCDSDMENILRSKNLGAFSLESQRRLSEFDILGFSLGSELNYTNALNILDLGGLPLKSALRGNDSPLIIAGGPSVLNPEPIAEFFDIIVIGEAEEVLLELIALYRKHKQDYKTGRIKKEELLFILSGVEGIYVPCFYEASYDNDGRIKGFKAKVNGAPLKIKKRFVRDLDSSFFPEDWLLPYIQIIHDRITLEITRGCPNKCRFCQARTQYYPLRERSLERILNLAACAYRKTGYEEISLAGLSVSEYSRIEELISFLISSFNDRKVGISLPSIKAKEKSGALSSLIAKIKKTGLTFAPEAGTDRLRNILAKDFDEEIFFKALEEAYLSGYQRVKLYFIIGLPTEEEKDLDAIIEFSSRVSELRRKVAKYPAQVNISINTLIPKPHTPFQWLKMQDIDTTKSKQAYLRKRLSNKRLSLHFHNSAMGFIEGVLSRGNRRLSEVILAAFSKGARFDAWGNYFRPDIWMDAFNEAKIDPHFYLQERLPEEILPWDFLDTGIEKDLLLAEFNKLFAMK